MGQEASKTKALWGDYEWSLLQGKGLDIGSGGDPISDSVDTFDIEDGDANCITDFLSSQYNFIFSCHCLEHMHDSQDALKQWWSLLAPGGHMILVVPDEDLYEQGFFPSLFNADHKATFTIAKQQSWSPNSYNLIELINELDNSDLIRIRLQDQHYDRTLVHRGKKSRRRARLQTKLVRRLSHWFGWAVLSRQRLARIFGTPYDQTGDKALAQIEAIIRKQ